MAERLLTPEEKTAGAPDGVTNFKYSELEYYDTIPPEYMANATELLKQLQIIRNHIGKPISIISGYRSYARQMKVNPQVTKSKHMTAEAADIQIKGMSATDIHQKISELIKSKKIINGGLGLYVKSNFVHYDIRSDGPARWNGD
jgi:uncharacterized protein YcbK (DUF882 family)